MSSSSNSHDQEKIPDRASSQNLLTHLAYHPLFCPVWPPFSVPAHLLQPILNLREAYSLTLVRHSLNLRGPSSSVLHSFDNLLKRKIIELLKLPALREMLCFV